MEIAALWDYWKGMNQHLHSSEERSMINGTEKVSVLGSYYSVMTRSRAHEILLQEALSGKRGYVCVSNVHTTMTGFFHREYRHVTNAAA